MPYYLRTITAAGTPAFSATPCASVEAAMMSACATFRYGATDAWIDDENGQKVADLEMIKEYCGTAESSN